MHASCPIFRFFLAFILSGAFLLAGSGCRDNPGPAYGPGQGPQLSGEEPTIFAVPFGTPPGTPSISATQIESAKKTLAADAGFQKVVGSHSWEVVVAMPNFVGGKGATDGFALIVELDQPIDSDGPWRTRICRDTRTFEFRFPYRGVQQLAALFDAKSRLKKLVVFHSPTLTFSEDHPTVKSPRCLPGLEDPEN